MLEKDFKMDVPMFTFHFTKALTLLPVAGILLGCVVEDEVGNTPSAKNSSCSYTRSGEFFAIGIGDYALEPNGLVSVSKIDMSDAGIVDHNGITHFGEPEIILMNCAAKTHIAIDETAAQHYDNSFVSTPTNRFFSHYMAAARQNNATGSFQDFANFALSKGILNEYISAAPESGFGIPENDADCICSEFGL